MDAWLDLIAETTGSAVFERNNDLLITGGGREVAAKTLEELLRILEDGETLDRQKVAYVAELAEKGLSYTKSCLSGEIICFNAQGRPVRPKTIGQKAYITAMREKDIVFGIGPAGTGKTYLAVAMAVAAYKNKEVKKILLTRPAVEAGEKLGFLPGDLQEKVDPYLRPVYDALHDLLGREQTLRLKEKEAVEIVPLAYMRGRTLDQSFIILDEAQNTTGEQMKMFLTRMGFGSRVVVTGDVTQIDLPREKKSGLLEAERVLQNVEGLSFCLLKEADVVRHPLVRRIIRAYAAFEEGKRCN